MNPHVTAAVTQVVGTQPSWPPIGPPAPAPTVAEPPAASASSAAHVAGTPLAGPGRVRPVTAGPRPAVTAAAAQQEATGQKQTTGEAEHGARLARTGNRLAMSTLSFRHASR